eukprot:sb/3475397/
MRETIEISSLEQPDDEKFKKKGKQARSEDCWDKSRGMWGGCNIPEELEDILTPAERRREKKKTTKTKKKTKKKKAAVLVTSEDCVFVVQNVQTMQAVRLSVCDLVNYFIVCFIISGRVLFISERERE